MSEKTCFYTNLFLSMNVHFIAIGGSAMHNLAIALNRKGTIVTGSDDEIFEPSKSRLEKEGILPEQMGWNAELITSKLDAVIVGMHARLDNPELLKAQELGLKIFSYPEYLYEQSKDKKRIVIGGSHGKTTITSMLLHATKVCNVDVDYMVGAQLEGYDCMVRLSEDAKFMVLEGDEYLSSPTDRRPKFHLYNPDVALISGIAWDHINVFPTFENYVDQFAIFCSKIAKNGTLIYNREDEEVAKLGEMYNQEITSIPYETPSYSNAENGFVIQWENVSYPLQIFGRHNMQNLIGAMYLAKEMGIENTAFLKAMATFTGAGKRLQLVRETEDFSCYKDFAHSPSKLKATLDAVRERFPERQLIACMELHTFSSLQKDFLPHYFDCMKAADISVVYYSPDVVKHKKLAPISSKEVFDGFGGNVNVLTSSNDVRTFLGKQNYTNTTLLMMSSGNFDGIDYDVLVDELLTK